VDRAGLGDRGLAVRADQVQAGLAVRVLAVLADQGLAARVVRVDQVRVVLADQGLAVRVRAVQVDQVQVVPAARADLVVGTVAVLAAVLVVQVTVMGQGSRFCWPGRIAPSAQL